MWVRIRPPTSRLPGTQAVRSLGRVALPPPAGPIDMHSPRARPYRAESVMASIAGGLARRANAATTASRRSRLVRERARFIRREVRKRPVVGAYSLATSNGGAVFLRHDTLDTWTLEEVFGFQVYTLPLPVRGRLVNLTRPHHVADLGSN